MRIGLLGDIHGNDLALTVVLSAAKASGVEKLLITGDLVGYYFAPERVLQLLEPWDKLMVRGNHEDMLKRVAAQPGHLPELEKQYGSGLRVALERLTPPQIAGLCSLPHPLEVQIDGRRILLCHGAPWDNDQYVYPGATADLLERCAVPGYDVVIMGHTHYPMIHKIGDTLLINPGSVGQPRDRHPGAAWAVFDTISLKTTLKHETYDFQPLVEEASRRHPDFPYLANVLTRT